MKAILSAAAIIAIAGAATAQSMDSTRLASSPNGDALFLREDQAGIIAYYNADPLTQPWSSGTTLSLTGSAFGQCIVRYTGNGRYLAGWNESGSIYSAYTDDGATWSSPLRIDDPSVTDSTNLLDIASDGNGTVLMQFSQAQQYIRRSTDGGATFQGKENQSYGFMSSNVRMSTDGAGTWYRASTIWIYNNFPTYYAIRLENSVDEGHTWTLRAHYPIGPFTSRSILGNAGVGNRATVIAYDGRYDRGQFITHTSENSGTDWAISNLPADMPAYFATDYLNDSEAAIACDNAGNQVVLYRAKYTDADDYDILGMKSASASDTAWDTTLRFVSRQRDRNEISPMVTSLGTGKFLAVYHYKYYNSTLLGAQTAISTDAGATWTPGSFIWGSVLPGEDRDYSLPEIPVEPEIPITLHTNGTRPDGTYAANPRLAASPTGSAVCVQLDPAGIIAHYSANPLTQAWAGGNVISAPISEGLAPESADIAYAGNGRYVAAWIVANASSTLGEVYSAYTDDGINWSAPVRLDVDDDSQTTEPGKSSITIASDGQSIVNVGWIGNLMRMKIARSVDAGMTYDEPVLQLHENGKADKATKLRLVTNGNTWYSIYTKIYGVIPPNPPDSSGYVRFSRDGGLTWDEGYRFTQGQSFDLVQSAAVYSSLVYVLTGNTFMGMVELSDNGIDWGEWLSAAEKLPAYYLNASEVAIDNAGNSVIVYPAHYTDAPDIDILSINTKSDFPNPKPWNYEYKLVSNQVNRAENAPAIVSLGLGKFLTVIDVADSLSTGTRGILAKTSTDAGNTWNAGTFISGSVATGELRNYNIAPPPTPDFTISLVKPKIKYKEPKPGKPPKPRKATFNVVINANPELTSPKAAEIKLYLSDDDTLFPPTDTLLYSGTTKPIKPGKSGKLNIKFKDFPDPAGKWIMISVDNGQPYVLPSGSL